MPATVLMLMFNFRSDLGGGSNPPQGGGIFSSSSAHRLQSSHATSHRHSGQRSVTTWDTVKERCERTCLTKAWKNLAMMGLLAMHLGTMFAILSHKGVPPFISDTILMQVLGILMAVGGATCVIMSVLVFRRQKRRLHPCMCLESGSRKGEEPVSLGDDVYVPSTQGHSFQSFHHSHPGLLQSHVHYDVVRATLPERDVSVVLTAPPVQREAPLLARSPLNANQRVPGASRHAYKNSAFEDRTRKCRARSEPNVHEQKVRYKVPPYRGRPPFILRGGQVDLEQLTMSSLV